MRKKDKIVDVPQSEADPLLPSPANRARAAKLRSLIRAGGHVAPEDAAWLADYDSERERVSAQKFGARSHKVEYSEESSETAATGAVAEVAAAAAMVREEGRRPDSLISVGIAALRTAVDTYQRMAEQLLKRNEQLEHAHVDMMRLYRRQALETIEAEAEAVRLAKEAEDGDEKDGISKLAEQLLPYLLPALGGPDMSNLPGSKKA